MKKIITFVFVSLALSSCSFFKDVTKKEKMKITSVPENVFVYNEKNEFIGKTPLELSSAEIERNRSGNYIPLTLKVQGYVDLQVVADINGLNATDIKMEKISEDHFKKWVFSNYKNEINSFSKDLLSVQWLIFIQKFSEARLKAFDLNVKYPNIAVVFTMMAQIEMQEKKYSQAKIYIEKALQLDEKDVTAMRMLTLVNAYLKENN